ncbi:hypothetical protein [Mycolicibacterium sarraceniae]|uniref:Uncharacterized protein n=1 Tax=Mycolicibacterium sarraceniae TaxID=1534348 RepID=A0A7I7SYF0_9MYCO|nr:hypothetical protein [Mycolicibacterium sarraceniae]BBY60846.1 hypothetical protein MSAR_39820 [Mycolicibacterium sarraceniae]
MFTTGAAPRPWRHQLAGLWLGLFGVAIAAGLAMVMRANTEIPEDYWRSIVNY